MTSIKEGFAVAVSLLSAKIGSPALMIVVYQKDSDEYVDIPNYGDFISTDLAPRGLSLNTKANPNNNNLPFDRIKKLAEYGVTAPAANSLPGAAASGLPTSAPAAFQAPTQAPAPATFAAPAQVATPAFAPAAPASNVI